jgi:aminopeptidase N
MQFAEDAGPMAHPIRPEKVLEMNNFYTLTVYEKGAEVIRMLHTLLGKDYFRSGMDLYFKRFDGMAVTCDDFIDAMSDASGKDLMQFKLWYSQSGTPSIRVNESFDEIKGEYHLTLAQQSPITLKQSVPKPLHIPVKLELIVNDNSETNLQEHLIEFIEQEQSWVFNGLKSKPTLALFADFSAPVKVNFIQDDLSLFTIISKAKNSFCRWDAGQKLLMSTIKSLTLTPSFKISQQLITCFTDILNSDDDMALIAEQLALPSFDEAADLIDQVDPISLVNAISTLTTFMAKELEKPLLIKFKACALALEQATLSDADVISNKALKNTCLTYLAAIDKHALLVEQQFNSSDNMTDSLAALNCAAKYNLTSLPIYMAEFEKKWSTTPLVMDKWFSLGASVRSDDIFKQLDMLINHELFSIKNPNRARSLIGAFAMNNPRYFHSATGKGYKFLADKIAQLNLINPQVASKLITPLIQFNSFAQPYKTLMEEELVRIQSLPNLSNDLKEKLDAALAT